MQTDTRKRWGYTPNWFIPTQADWQEAAQGVDMQPPRIRDWMDVLILMTPAYHTSDYKGETCTQIR